MKSEAQPEAVASRPAPPAGLLRGPWHVMLWLLGYRDVPMRSRLNFRIDLQSQLLWSAMMAAANPKLAQAIATNLMHNSSPLVQAVLQASTAVGNLFSFLWAHLATGKSSLRFILIPSLLSGLFAIAVGMVPLDAPYLFSLLIVGLYISYAGVVNVRSAVWHLNYHRAGVGNIVSRFQVLSLIVATVVAALGGFLLTQEGELRGRLALSPSTAFRLLFVAMGVCGIVGGLLCQRGHASGEEPARRDAARTSVLAGLRILRHDRAYRQFLGFMMVFGFGTMLGDTVLVLMMNQRFEQVNSTVMIMVLLVLAPSVVQLISMPFAGRLLDRSNPMRLRIYGAIAWSSSALLLYIAARSGSVSLLVASRLLSGLGGGLGGVAWQLGHMHFARKDLVQHYMGLHVSATGLRGIIAPFLAVMLWEGRTLPAWLGGLHVPQLGVGVFFISMVMQVVGGLGFWWMDRRYKTLTPLGPEVVI